MKGLKQFYKFELNLNIILIYDLGILATVDPFANATKQVNDACDVLKIKDKGLREYLAMPNKVLRVKIPVKMVKGKIRVFTRFRSQHYIDRGPYKVGFR